MPIDISRLERALAEHKVYDAWQYVKSLQETLGYMSVSYNMLLKVHYHRVTTLATVGQDIIRQAHETGEGRCTTDDLNRTNLVIGGYEIDDVVSNFISSDINTSYAATYYPWVKYYDADNKVYINLPVTKDVVRSLAYTDNTSYPWFAPAGIIRGGVECEKAHYITKLEDEDTLYEGMINPVKTFATDGVKIWGQKTMYGEDTPLNRINVRRLMLRVKKLISGACRRLIFEQNDATVKSQFEGLVRPILDDIK